MSRASAGNAVLVVWCVIAAMLLVLLLLAPTCVLSLDNGLSLTPPMGWNEYNFYRNLINESTVRATADALVKRGLAQLGYVYVNLDDCWQIDREASTGRIVVDKSQFPSGIAPLSDYVHSLGLKFGLYSDSGTRTCAGRPGSLGFEQIDALTYAEWNVDFLKYDNCNNNNTDPKVRYPTMSRALNHTGRSILFAMCEWGQEDPATWAVPISNTWRTTGDIDASWSSLIGNARINDQWWSYAGPGGWNDPDMLEVGVNPSLSPIEQRTHFSLWALMKSPLILGMDLIDVSQEVLNIVSNTEVIALNQDPLGVQGHHVNPGSGAAEVWAGSLQGGDAGVLLFNSGGTTVNITVTWAQLGWAADRVALVRDLWEHRDIGSFTSSYTGTAIASHDSRTLRITPIKQPSTHYVSPLGKDVGPCIQTTPCRSISYAFRAAHSGDVIHVAAGEYGDEVLIRTSDSAVGLITISGQPTGIAAVTLKSLTLTNAPNVIVDSVTILSSTKAAMRLTNSNYVTLSNSIIRNSSSYGLTGINVTHLSLVNITIDNSQDHNIYLGGPTAHITLINSRIWNSAKIGVHLDPYIYSVSGAQSGARAIGIQSQARLRNGGPTYLTNVLIRDNLLSNNAQGDVICAGMQNSSILNNIMFGPASAVALFPWEDVPGPSNVVILHNTAYSTADSGNSFYFSDVVGPVFLRNNLVISGGHSNSSRVSVQIEKTADVSHLDSDYNLFSKVELAGVTHSLTDWRQMYPLEKHSLDGTGISADLMWVHPGAFPGADYHLRPTSTDAIGRGIYLSAAAFDFAGSWRGGGINGTVSLGAMEFITNPVQPLQTAIDEAVANR